MRYFNECCLPAFTSAPAKLPPTMQYFMKIVDILKNMKKEDLGERSILLGPPQKIIDTLKKVEASGVAEVIPGVRRASSAICCQSVSRPW
jgi:hypothetical protein